MPFSTYASDYALNQLAANHLLYASLHSAYSASGANELTGGSYARVAATWGTASGETMSLSGTPYTFSVPASSTVAWVGFWDASTSGNFQGMLPNGGSTPYAFAAPSSTGTLLAPNSAYSANQQVVVVPTGGSTLPSGLTVGTIYYVVSPSSDSFKLSATSSGSAITLSTDGSGVVQGITPEVFGGAGSFAVNSGSWNLV
jgi:hypothetical protein